MIDAYTTGHTPIEKRGDVWLKRDDLHQRAGIRGGKVRACWHLATYGEHPCDGLITASARKSPQAQIVARVAALLGVPARCHMPTGDKTEEMRDAEVHGAELVQHRAGYNNVIISRALADHKERSRWRYIPFGMEHREAMGCTRGQVSSLLDMPEKPRRIVVTVGSGMSAAGILHGLRDHDLRIPVLGVRIGADPRKRLDTYAPAMWRQGMQLVTSRHDYAHHHTADIDGVAMDPHYEAKAVEYVMPGDLFWVIGIRNIGG